LKFVEKEFCKIDFKSLSLCMKALNTMVEYLENEIVSEFLNKGQRL